MAAPVKHTCPEIDKYIRSIKDVMVRNDRTLMQMSEDDIRDTAIQMNNELHDCIEYLESLRQSNEELRNWGEELDGNLSSAAEEINELSERLDAAEKRVHDLEYELINN